MWYGNRYYKKKNKNESHRGHGGKILGALGVLGGKKYTVYKKR